jgi:hypothetical protein
MAAATFVRHESTCCATVAETSVRKSLNSSLEDGEGGEDGNVGEDCPTGSPLADLSDFSAFSVFSDLSTPVASALA